MTARNCANDAIAAFIVVFLMLIANAGAATYSECPYSTKIENAWWDANECEGGIYGYGSLYLKWSDAPFTNETHEVTSIELKVSGFSQGTDFTILMWNGYSWSSLDGGTLDFRGDYVYDLYGIPGAYADGSMRIKIVNTGAETLHISGIKAVVEYESVERDLTITVKNCETSRKLEGVEITADGQTVETNEDGVAVLHLAKETLYEVEIGGDDYYEIVKRVYLYDNEDVEVCVYRFEDHAVEVDDLEVDDGIISFIVRNIGNVDNDEMHFWVYVDERVIFDGYLVLDAGEDDDVIGSYSFTPGRHRVRAKAQVEGYVDSETVTYCFEGYTDNYMCSSDGNVLREFIKSGCVSQWKVVEYCREGCADGRCTSDGGIAPPDDEEYGVCDIEITSFSYADGIPANKYEELEVRIRNEGEGTVTVTAKLYVDGSYEDTDTVTVKEGQTGKADFRFRMTEGTHSVKVIASACGGRETTANVVSVKVNPPVLDSGGFPEGREPEEAPEVPVTENIHVEVETDELFSEQCGGLAFRVMIHPLTEDYRLSVTGVDQEWLSYPRVVGPANADNVYVFLSPEEGGNYTLTVKAWLKDDPDVSDDETVRLQVTPKETAAGASGPGPAGGDGRDAEGGDVTGMAVLTQSPWLGLLIFAALVAVVMILVFARHYMVEDHSYGSRWNPPVTEHDEYKKATLDDFSSFE